MFNDEDLGSMKLPKVNPNEALEVTSENKLKLLFPLEQFLFCGKDERDKGIDLRYELIQGNYHTGFRFEIQLKAKNKLAPNSDGTYSIPVNTSNIQYLLNQNNLAYYVLYIDEKDAFFYRSVLDIHEELRKNDKDWGLQDTHTIRFHSPLDLNTCTVLYDTVLQYCRFQRNVRDKLIQQSSTLQFESSVVINTEMKVHDDATIRKYVEVLGQDLINEGRWNEILTVHEKGSGSIASTPLYNLILGIANYYGGSRFSAIKFLKTATQGKSELTSAQQKHLTYVDAAARYSLGIIGPQEYDQIIAALEESDEVGLHVKLDVARTRYQTATDSDPHRAFQQLKSDIDSILNDPRATENLKLTCRSEFNLHEGQKLNQEYLNGILILKGTEDILGINMAMRKELSKTLHAGYKIWANNVNRLAEDCTKAKNYFAYYTSVLNHSRVKYQRAVFASVVPDALATSEQIKAENEKRRGKLELVIERTQVALSYFNTVCHVENTIVAFSIIYELAHFLDKKELANESMLELERLVQAYDLKELQEKQERLKNKGTQHEQLNEFLQKAKNDVLRKHEAEIRVNKALLEIDAKEKTQNLTINAEWCVVTVFPLGNFTFPKERMTNLFSLLNITSDHLMQHTERMLVEEIIPIFNAYNSPVISEGPLNGHMENKRIENVENVLRVRTELFENGFVKLFP